MHTLCNNDSLLFRPSKSGVDDVADDCFNHKFHISIGYLL